MPVRPLSSEESGCADTLRAYGMMTRVEWMAALDIDQSTVVAFRTDRRPDSTDPDAAMRAHWDGGGSLIIHHNHPSDESLSSADWRVLIDYPVPEIFAHTIDGSIFYGALLDRDGATAALANYDDAGIAAEAVIINALPTPPEVLGLANLLRKHTVALALAQKGCVDYQFFPGPVWAAILHKNATLLSAAVAAALAKL
jgi:hypothetical protein